MTAILQLLGQPLGKLAFLDVFVIGAYMLICLYIGFRKAGNITNIRDFALGQGTISTFVLIATIYATHLGAGMTFGTLEKIREIGMLFALAMLVSPIGWVVTILVFGRNIEQFKDCISLNDIMHELYGKVGRWATNIVSIFIAIGVIAAQSHAMGYLIHYYLDIPVALGIVIGIGVLVTYSAFGGIRAVATTDLLQFLVFYVAIPYMCAIGLLRISELPWVHKGEEIQYLISTIAIPDKYTMEFTSSNITMFIGFIIYSELFGSGSTFVQRFLMARDSGQLVQALKVVAVLDFVMVILLCLLGLISGALLPEAASPKTAFLEAISMLLPAGIKGFLVTGLLAVIMSTADSWLNTASVLCAHDVAKQLWPSMSDKTELRIARCVTVVIGILSVTLALSGAGILELIWLVDNFYAPIILIPLSVGFLGLRTNTTSFMTSVALAMTLTLTTAFIQGSFDVISLIVGLLGSAVGLFGTHYWQLWTGRMERRAVERNPSPSIRDKLIARILAIIQVFHPQRIIRLANRTARQDPPRYYSFAVLGLIYCLCPFLILVMTGDPLVHTFSIELILRIIGIMGCAALCFHELLPVHLRDKYLAIYWYTLLIWCLPMLGSYGLILRYDNTLWAANAGMALLMLVAFADQFSMMLLLVLGVMLGVLLSSFHLYFEGYGLAHTSHVARPGQTLAVYLPLAIGVIWELGVRLKNLLSLSTIDKLTGLRNRRYLDLNLADMVEDARESGQNLSLLMLDMDHFGRINKEYSHHAGDMVLQELGHRIRRSVWQKDICIRYGGEEFIVLMRETSMDEAMKVAERLNELVGISPFTVCDSAGIYSEKSCTASIGVATLTPADDAVGLVTRADAGLKLAKLRGRNTIVAASKEEAEIVAQQAESVTPLA